MLSNDGLRVYVYQGNDGEKVPRSVQHLIVKDGVRVLPAKLCNSFHHQEYQRLLKVTFPDGLISIGDSAFDVCLNLLETNIPRTVEVIGDRAFACCERLKKIEFEDRNGTLPPQLRSIGQETFSHCEVLERVKLPPSVYFVGYSAFYSCNVLVEANLSATFLTYIQDWIFASCTSLLTVSLPNTITRIGAGAFHECFALVTMVVPFDSKSITIEGKSFDGCTSLANLFLPKGSTVEDYEDGDEPFRGCRVLHARFGDDTTSIVAALESRFDASPIHRLCYDHSRVTVQELRRCISDHQEANSFVDDFGMTPLHVFFSTPEPRVELLEVLLESLPYQLVQRQDANDKRSLDYLVTNWTDAKASLFQINVQKWVIDRLARWGSMSWMEAMQSEVQGILSEQDKDQRSTLCDDFLSVFDHCSNVEATSMLELALWKMNLRSGRSSDGSKRQALNRDSCRRASGSDVVIPNVFSFLKIPQEYEDDGSEGTSESENIEDDGPEGSSESESSAESSAL